MMIDKKFLMVAMSIVALAACGKSQAPPPKAVADAPAPTPTGVQRPLPVHTIPSTTASVADAPPPPTPTHMSHVHAIGFRMGTAVNAHNGIQGESTAAFTPHDTIYASISTMSPERQKTTVTARWMYQDSQLVNETSKEIAGGTQFSEFHIAKADGWPAGEYTVTISAGDDQIAKKKFHVQ